MSSHKGQALNEVGSRRLAECLAMLLQQEHQSGGIHAAISNLETHCNQMTRVFEAFREQHQQDAAKHQLLLDNFEGDLDRVQGIPLHPTLCNEHRAVLADCVPMDRERQWRQQCEQSLQHFGAKIAQIEGQHEAVREGVRQEVASCAAVRAQMAQQGVADAAAARQAAAAQAERAGVLQDSCAQMRATMTDIATQLTASTQSPGASMASTSALEACRLMEESMVQQEPALRAMQDADGWLEQCMERCCARKSALAQEVYHRLRSVSKLQSEIRNAHHNVAAMQVGGSR
jgi:hypothetical protein